MSVLPKQRYAVIAAAVAVAAATTLSACSSSSGSSPGAPPLTAASGLQDPTKPVTIHYVGAAYSADDLKPVLAAFHKAHPTITVQYESVPQANLNSVLSTRFGQKSVHGLHKTHAASDERFEAGANL